MGVRDLSVVQRSRRSEGCGYIHRYSKLTAYQPRGRFVTPQHHVPAINSTHHTSTMTAGKHVPQLSLPAMPHQQPDRPEAQDTWLPEHTNAGEQSHWLQQRSSL